MDFDFNLSDVLNANSQGIVILDGVNSMRKGAQHYSAGVKVDPHQKLLNEVIDIVGESSSTAQKLPSPVTNAIKFFGSEDKLYLIVDQFKAIGMLKIGYKKLFVRDEIGNMKEIQPLCILDFYVHESHQREGYGKYLFQYMLDEEKVEPHKIAYDRPSNMFLKFLKKHYGLINYVPQPNNFVVFSNYFANDKTYKTYIKDPIKPRSAATHPKEMASKVNSQSYAPAPVGFAAQGMSQPKAEQFPSYKDVLKMRQESREEEFDPINAPLYPTGTGFEDEKENYYKKPAPPKQSYEAMPREESRDSKKVSFADAPQYYEANNKEDSDFYQANPDNSAPRDGPLAEHYAYNNYDGYQAPAGRSYMDPEIEK